MLELCRDIHLENILALICWTLSIWHVGLKPSKTLWIVKTRELFGFIWFRILEERVQTQMARVIPIIVPDVLYKAVGGQNFMQMLPLQRKTKSMEYIILCLPYNVMVFIKRFIAGILFYIYVKLCTFLLNERVCKIVHIFIHISIFVLFFFFF